MRNGVEGPGKFARDNIEGTDITGRRNELFAGRGAEDDEILEDLARRAGVDAINGADITAQTLAQVHEAVVAESENRLTGLRVKLLDLVVDLEDETTVLLVLTFPVVDAPLGDALETFVNPDLFARCGIHGYQRCIARQNVHHTINDDGVEHIRTVVLRGISPRNLQLTYVGLIQLLQIHKVGVIGATPEICPLGFLCGGRQGEQGSRNNELANHFAAPAGAAFGLPQKMKVPRSVDVVMSRAPSLFRSTAVTVDPTPERL